MRECDVRFIKLLEKQYSSNPEIANKKISDYKKTIFASNQRKLKQKVISITVQPDSFDLS